MDPSASELLEDGLEVYDLEDESILSRRQSHLRDASKQMNGMHRLATAFVERPESILQELVEAAVQLCGADSAGVSIERDDRTELDHYRWIAAAGEYTPFLDASLPRYPSACSVCLLRGGPQLFKVHQRFFDIVGVKAALITDGILLPWVVEEMRGTIFVIAHGRSEAFDMEDLRMMQVLAGFAAMGVRHQRQQAKLLKQAGASAAAAMANDLAHQINNPLQSLTNILFLAREIDGPKRELAEELLENFERLSALVQELLAIPKRRARGVNDSASDRDLHPGNQR